MKKSVFSPVVMSFIVFITALPAFAGMNYSESGKVVVSSEDILKDDVVLAGSSIEINGTAKDDIIAFAQKITINGTIEHDLMGAAQYIDINGKVMDDARIAAQNIRIKNHVGSNLTAFCQNMTLGKDGSIGGNANIFSYSTDIHGIVDGNLCVRSEKVFIEGSVNGDVYINASSIYIGSNVSIKGNLKYKSPVKAEISEHSKVAGIIEWVKTEPKDRCKKGCGAFGMIFKAIFVIGMIIIGIIIAVIVPKQVVSITDAMGSSFLKSIGIGFLFVICVPVLVFLLLITLIGIPLAGFIAVAYFFIFYLAKVFAGFFIGRKILGIFSKGKSVSMVLSAIIGILIFALLAKIPVLGCILCLFAWIWASGAFVMTRYSLFKVLKSKGEI